MSCDLKIVETELPVGIPELSQVRMSQFQNLNTVHPSAFNAPSFFASAALLLRWLCPSSSIAIRLRLLARSTLYAVG